jgi:hypothetical protein
VKLKVSIEIYPPADTVDALTMDSLLNGELVEFERWFVAQQKQKGAAASGLIGAERGILKAYLIYATTARKDV